MIIAVIVILWWRTRMGDKSQEIHPVRRQSENLDEQGEGKYQEMDLLNHEEKLRKSREISGEYGLQLIWKANQVFQINKLPAIIGSAEDNDVLLADTSVSGTHACIYFDERIEAVCIEDLDSLNGVYINDKPTCKNILDDGAKIALGNVTLTFRNMGYIPPQSPS